MRNVYSYQPRPQALASVATASQRSWIPTPPHLLVAVDPTRWMQRASDQRWQAQSHRPTRN